MTEWDPRPIEDIEAEAASAAAVDAAGDGGTTDGATTSAVRKQLLLLGLFALCVLLLFVFASTALATGDGCGGG